MNGTLLKLFTINNLKTAQKRFLIFKDIYFLIIIHKQLSTFLYKIFCIQTMQQSEIHVLFLPQLN